MKGLSVLLTLALLILAHELSVRFKSMSSRLTAVSPQPSPRLDQAEVQLLARTNTRGVKPARLPAFRAEGRFRGYSFPPFREPGDTTLEL